MKEEDTFRALSRFQESRRALAEAADALAALAAKRRDTGLSMRAWSLARELDDARFRVALVGGRKRGKSTLVNALVGARLLPAGVVPMTSLVTTVGYGEEARASVHLAGGESREVGLDRLADYAAGKEGAERARSVSVEYPSPLLGHGVTLVDTPDAEPGEVGGAETYGRLAEDADLVLLLLSADQPAGRAEIDLLRGLVGRTGTRVLVVQNKADYLPEDELRESLDFLRGVLGRELGGGGGVAGVIQVSAKQALRARLGGEAAGGADGVSHLEKRIAEVLGGERGGALLAEASARLGRLALEASQYVALETRAALLPEDELRRLTAKFREGVGEVFTAQRRAEFEARRDASALASRVRGEIESLTAGYRETVDRRVEEAFSRPGTLRGRGELIRALSEELAGAGRRLLGECRAVVERHAGQSPAWVEEVFARHAAGVVEALERLTGELFGVEVTLPVAGAEPAGYGGGRGDVQPASPRPAVGMMPLILPARLARRAARPAFRRAARETIRLAAGMGEGFRREVENATQGLIRDFQERTRLNVGKVEEALERAGRLRHERERKREARLALLAKDAAKLEAIREVVIRSLPGTRSQAPDGS
jgi:hypothetical protein